MTWSEFDLRRRRASSDIPTLHRAPFGGRERLSIYQAEYGLSCKRPCLVCHPDKSKDATRFEGPGNVYPGVNQWSRYRRRHRLGAVGLSPDLIRCLDPISICHEVHSLSE